MRTALSAFSKSTFLKFTLVRNHVIAHDGNLPYLSSKGFMLSRPMREHLKNIPVATKAIVVGM